MSPDTGQEVQTPEIITDPVESAKAAGLRYVSDSRPGITRKRAGKYFSYIKRDGSRVRDPAELTRIKALGIPPAWTQVWICPDPRGHLQATGRDAKGRKQYRYHTHWSEVRNGTKYDRMIAFGQALPSMRERVDRDLSLPGMPREKVLATIVRLLETTFIRIGNEEYARTNRSFGLTTMRTRHVKITGSTIHFQFRGKSGKYHRIDLQDGRLARLVKHIQELPGQELFHYLDGDGKPQTIDSNDVNQYLREISGQDFTAKDFRTWAGTVLGLGQLRKYEPGASQTQVKKNLAEAIKNVAESLGNTPAVCRKCYVHPAVIDVYTSGSLLSALEGLSLDEIADVGTPGSLKANELAVMTLLQMRLMPQSA